MLSGSCHLQLLERVDHSRATTCDVVAGTDRSLVSNVSKYTHFTLQLSKQLVSVNRDVNSFRDCILAYRVKSKNRRPISTKANSEVWHNVSRPVDKHRKRGYRLLTTLPPPRGLCSTTCASGTRRIPRPTSKPPSSAQWSIEIASKETKSMSCRVQPPSPKDIISQLTRRQTDHGNPPDYTG